MKIDEVTRRFLSEHEAECAYRPYSWQQAAFYLLTAAIAVWFLLYRWDLYLTVFNLLLALFYLAMIGFRSLAVAVAWFSPPDRRATPAELAQVSDLPVYTILVPLYNEPEVVETLLHHLGQLDYPTGKLDIKLLLEEDDAATLAIIERTELPPCYDVIVVPDSQPKTKPKACNHGLARATGDFLVIFDAEDRPDPDQLKQVIWVFRQAAPEVACVQAKLDYFNPRQNLLTRWFAIEYAAWFSLFLPGLQRLRVPIPLGGTSNHFRTALLRELGGWDPFNVTEDCDLGVRLYKHGYRTEMVDATTWEEANSRLGNWLRQRSRWVKGFLQTHLTHLRHPWRTWRALGLRGTLGFYLSVGSVPATLILNVGYWVMLTVYAVLLGRDWAAGRDPWTIIAGPRDEFRYAWKMIFIGPQEDPFWSRLSVVFFVITVALLLANLLFVAVNVAACFRRGYRDLLLAAILSPLYWVLMSLAALKGVTQFFTRPFYWEKTTHGIDDQA